MESFSSTATWMILLRVAALSSRLPVQPRMSTAMPMAIVLCLKGRRWAIRPGLIGPGGNETKLAKERTGFAPFAAVFLRHTGSSHSLVADCKDRPPPSEWLQKGLSGRPVGNQKGQIPQDMACSALEQGAWRGLPVLKLLRSAHGSLSLSPWQVHRDARSPTHWGILWEAPKSPGLGNGRDRKMR